MFAGSGKLQTLEFSVFMFLHSVNILTPKENKRDLSNNVSDCWFHFPFHYSHQITVLADIKLNMKFARKYTQTPKIPKLLIITDWFKEIHCIDFFIFLELVF